MRLPFNPPVHDKAEKRTCVLVRMCYLFLENGWSLYTIVNMIPPSKHHRAAMSWGVAPILTQGRKAAGRHDGALWPAVTARSLSELLIYLVGDGTDVVLTVSVLLAFFKNYWQWKLKKKKVLGTHMFVNSIKAQGKQKHPELGSRAEPVFHLLYASVWGRSPRAGLVGRGEIPVDTWSATVAVCPTHKAHAREQPARKRVMNANLNGNTFACWPEQHPTPTQRKSRRGNLSCHSVPLLK